jgi:hypothetical protein
MRLSVEALNIGNKNYEIVRYFPMPDALSEEHYPLIFKL